MDFNCRFWVDTDSHAGPPWPRPYFRGLDHLVFVGLDSENSLLMDRRTRRAIGRFSPAMGADLLYWKMVIFPVLISITGTTVGITELHCGCVARDGRGLLLAGQSGSGKSTLAAALALAGFAYLSDDRTYLFLSEGRMVAWGLPTLLKLRPDAADWFRELGDLKRAFELNQDRALRIDPTRELGLEPVKRCEPRAVIFSSGGSIPGSK